MAKATTDIEEQPEKAWPDLVSSGQTFLVQSVKLTLYLHILYVISSKLCTFARYSIL